MLAAISAATTAVRCDFVLRVLASRLRLLTFAVVDFMQRWNGMVSFYESRLHLLDWVMADGAQRLPRFFAVVCVKIAVVRKHALEGLGNLFYGIVLRLLGESFRIPGIPRCGVIVRLLCESITPTANTLQASRICVGLKLLAAVTALRLLGESGFEFVGKLFMVETGPALVTVCGGHLAVLADHFLDVLKQ